MKQQIMRCTQLEIGDWVTFSYKGETFTGMIISWFHYNGYAQIAIPIDFDADEWWCAVLPLNDWAFNFYTQAGKLYIYSYSIDGEHWADFEYTYKYVVEDDFSGVYYETLDLINEVENELYELAA